MKIGAMRALAMAALLCTFACSSKGESVAAGTAIAEGEELSPAQLYQRKCASCHGAGGAGDGQLASAFPTVGDLRSAAIQDRYDDDGLATIMTRGIRRMPPVRGLSDAEVQALTEHVRGLRAE